MKQTKIEQIAEVLRNNPDITIKALAKKFNTTITYAYVLRSNARKLIKQPLTNVRAKPKKQKVIQGFTGKQYELMDFTPMPFSVEEVLQDANKDLVNSPAHYTVGGIETIDFIEAKDLNYHLGNAVKYIVRAEHKGNKQQDLEKAIWYLNRELNKTV
jgi:hypothetical protein